jgi:hypothetical protein
LYLHNPAKLIMNSHLALQARVHDYEEGQKNGETVKIQGAANANEETGEVDPAEASAEAEVETGVVKGDYLDDHGDEQDSAHFLGHGEATGHKGGDEGGEATPSKEWVRYMDDV